MGLGSVMYDISQDYVVDATLEYVYSSERDLARKHISKLESLDLIENSLIIFDRGYFSTDMFNFLVDAYRTLYDVRKKLDGCPVFFYTILR